MGNFEKICAAHGRRAEVVPPYGEAGNPFACQCAAARGCNMYEVLAAPLVDGPIKFETSRAARHILPIHTTLPANTTLALRDVRRAGKIFSYTGRGAFFFISEKEWGAHPRRQDAAIVPPSRAA